MYIGNKNFNLSNKTYIMGILNVTPDSFSDGGQYIDVEDALAQAKKMVSEGADIIDIGGESTRPGHQVVDVKEEIKRVVPVISAILNTLDIPISIDTSKSEVAKAAIEAGAHMVNDIWGFKKDKHMATIIAKHRIPCCLMHNRNNKVYNDIITDMINDLKESITIALDAGVAKEQIIIDPGIGFAKTLEQNLEVMRRLDEFKILGYPILLGTSRKSMIGMTLNLPVNERVEGTLSTTVIGIVKGCSIFRVHDVKANKRAAIMTDAIIRNGGPSYG